MTKHTLDAFAGLLMQRLNAASCLLFILLSTAAGSQAAERVKLAVVQIHTGVKLGGAANELDAAAETVWTRCTGASGAYSKELGYYCPHSEAGIEGKAARPRRGDSSFCDVSVIMPDSTRVVLHCSNVLGKNCEGFPEYPDQTNVVCSRFAFTGREYVDCTASGASSDGIGVYEAAVEGDKVTIFGPNWQRQYLRYGTWQFDEAAAQESKPAGTQEPKPAGNPAPTPENPVDGNQAAASAKAAAAADQAMDPQVIEQAKAGDAVAEYKLGYDYYLGRGVALDYEQAAIWWRKAAEQGYANAQNNLGVLYNSGRGVPQSYAEAYFWQNLAAARANGPLQAQFAKNRDESASRLGMFERLRVQRRAAKWAAAHPVPPRSAEPKSQQPN